MTPDRPFRPDLPSSDAPTVSDADLGAAARRLAAGELVAFPTETVYGLGARADDDRAVAKIFAAKGRPADHPLIVHVAGADAALRFAADLPPVARRLIDAFWPGPLTVVVPRRDGMATAAAAGLPTVGLRCPAHPVARRLLDAAAALGVPGLAAPSANRFGRISPTEARHVVQEFDGAIPVLDGGRCAAGIESAIVDVSRGHPVLLRPGVLTREAIEHAAGEPLRAPDAAAPRAPGTLDAHYAPRAALRLASADELRARAAAGEIPPAAAATDAAVYSRTPLDGSPAGGRIRRMPDDPVRAAHELFAVLRDLDADGVATIWVEAPPDDPAWEGVGDRLRRAAHRG